jgi:hypothetical protein
LFAWLDEHGAQECGDNIATFTSEEYFEDIAEEIAKKVHGGSRLYMVGRRKAPPHSLLGRFILGRRRAAPWTGFGRGYHTNESDSDE